MLIFTYMVNNVESKKFYTTAEIAEILKISRTAVFNKIKKGEINAQKMGRNFIVFKKDLGEIERFLSELFGVAKDWAKLKKEFPEGFYCQNSGVFQARASKMEMLLSQNVKGLSAILTSIAGEIGNNSFDHNLGKWPDVPGIFFGYDLGKKQIVLADRGLGILETLKRVKPELKDHKEALRIAFTEIISGREPEARGNGLKYVKKIISEYPINLIFQTGSAKLTLNARSPVLDIKNAPDVIRGCIALITYK